MKEMLDVIIPVYKPGKEFLKLLHRLQQQEYPVHKIILMNTEQKYLDDMISPEEMKEKYPKAEVHHLKKEEFDHAGTRDQGIHYSEAPYFLLMTQDALPADRSLTARLMETIEKKETAAAYARQLPREDCNEAERFTRDFNYPAESCIKSAQDLKRLGIKTYFCSNVCAIYNRSIYDELGGFQGRAIFNEDMVYAAAAVKKGYQIAYCAEAEVIHSHNYTGKEQFHRNFDLGVSQAQHPEIFKEVPSESEGIRMVRMTAGHLKQKKRYGEILKLIYVSGCKYVGYLLGKSYKHLPRFMIRACTMSRSYWDNI